MPDAEKITYAKESYSHRKKGKNPNPLYKHLTGVGKKASDSALSFNGQHFARLIGLWHDLGKYNPEFQVYLRDAVNDVEDAHLEDSKSGKRGPDHSSAGALYALKWLQEKMPEKPNTAKELACLFAYPIMGHHAGLADYYGGGSSLDKRLHNPVKEHLALAMQGFPADDILNPKTPDIDLMLDCVKDGRDIGFFVRMLFSCLVDADFLDTENYMSPEKLNARQQDTSIEALLNTLEAHLNRFGKASSPVNIIRSEVLNACKEKANNVPGFFSLIVPTGGGKTLSGLAFALSHSAKHKKKRIIYAIPYTSIIEQTAKIFKDIFCEYEDVVIEHHSNVSNADSSDETSRQRLASENWDAPIIVTTTVQLFESLHAYRTGRCRKLHNIANSVIILDEAHLIPPHLRHPILFSLQQLVNHYGVTVVLCTATPTGIENLEQKKYIPQLHHIINNADNLYTKLKRVEVVKREGVVSDWSDLASELEEHRQVLCIVGRRDDCKELHASMPEGTIHLSALMCAEHRSKVIATIKEKLTNKEPIRVISTQLVEAGVDIDFPVVYRAMAGLDSIAQAAGRCNREGQMEGLGKVVVFFTKRTAPRGILTQSYQAAEEALRQMPDGDLLSPPMQQEYFRHFYSRVRADEKDILAMNEGIKCRFREMAESFRMIEDIYKPVIVNYDKNDLLLEQLLNGKSERLMLRKAQRFIVTIPQKMLQDLLKSKAVKEVLPGLYVQDISYAKGLYHNDLGLAGEFKNVYESEDLVI